MGGERGEYAKMIYATGRQKPSRRHCYDFLEKCQFVKVCATIRYLELLGYVVCFYFNGFWTVPVKVILSPCYYCHYDLCMTLNKL